MIQNQEIVAIRSLVSKHHAEHIEPTVFTVTWNLGKRCNYDCSYCAPTTHDWVSPHHPLEAIKSFVDKLDHWTTQQNKTFKIVLTGGEPMVHPDILDILKTIKSAKSCSDQLTMTSNGSLPLELYQRSLEWITNLTISLHLERSNAEIQKKLDLIVALNSQFENRWISVQIMCLPGKTEFIDTVIIPLFDAHQIKFTIRKIRPYTNVAVEEWHNLEKRQIIKKKYPIKIQLEQKTKEKLNQQNTLEESWKPGNYYSADEIKWLNGRAEQELVWQNIGVWTKESQYFETNSDILVANNKNRFTGWLCWIGVDGIKIDFDGNIYKANCQTGGKIGNIAEDFTFSTDPVTCQLQWCISNSDHIIRKCDPAYKNLVTRT
jgi:molybdenum cofactor biosynthesis enzyme MoaA